MAKLNQGQIRGLDPWLRLLDKKKSGAESPREQEYYASFAEFLQKDLDEATVAVELGGAQRSSPDMFYVNEFAERLKLHRPDVFELFG